MNPPCSGCGRTDWIATFVMDDGTRYCARCFHIKDENPFKDSPNNKPRGRGRAARTK